MMMVINAIWAITMIASVVCWIMVLIPIFKQNVGLGILGVICSLFTFVYGWVKVKEFNCQKVMIIWSIALVVAIITQILGAGALFQQAAAEGWGM